MANDDQRPWWFYGLFAVGGGALGGLGWFAYVNALDQEPAFRGFWSAILAMALGALAGLVGTVLVKTDRTDRLHYIAVAIACGLSWKPVIESAKTVVKTTEEKREIVSLERMTKEASNAAIANPADAGKHIALVREAAVELVARSEKITDPVLKARAAAAASEAVQTLADVAAKDVPSSEEAVAALTQIGVAATKADSPRTATIVTEALAKIAPTSSKLAHETIKGLDAIGLSAKGADRPTAAADAHLLEAAKVVEAQESTPAGQPSIATSPALIEKLQAAEAIYSTTGDKEKAAKAQRIIKKLGQVPSPP